MKSSNKKIEKQTNDVCLIKKGRFNRHDMIAILIVLGIIVFTMVLFWHTSNTVAWKVRQGEFVEAEVNIHRVANVTWVRLADKELVYCTYNLEVLDLVPGERYWFGEGLPSGNYGSRLVWVADQNPFTANYVPPTIINIVPIVIVLGAAVVSLYFIGAHNGNDDKDKEEVI